MTAPAPCCFRARYRHTDEQLMRATKEVTERLGAKAFPTTAQFQRTRQLILDEEKCTGLAPRAFPSYNVLHRRFRSWPAVKRRLRAMAGQG